MPSASNQVNTDWNKNLEGCVTALYSFPASTRSGPPNR